MKLNYCEICGKENVGISTDRYDSETGMRVIKKVCLTGKCNHTGIIHNYKMGWDGFRCTKCKRSISAIC